MHEEDLQRKALISEGMLLLLAIIWGGTFVACKYTLAGMDPYWILVIRFFLGAGLLAIIFRQELPLIDRYTLLASIEIGLYLGVGIAFQMVGLKYTSPSQQSFIIVTYVVIVPFLNWLFYKEFPGYANILGAIVTFIGVGFLSLTKGFSMKYGDVLTFIYAFLFALQILRVSKHVGKVPSPMAFTVLNLFFAGVVSLIIALFKAGPLMTGPMTSSVFWGLMYLIFLNTALAYVLQNYAQQYARPEKVVIIMSTESLFGALAGYFLTGDVFTAKKILGCVLIFVGNMIAQLGPRVYQKHKKTVGRIDL